MRREEHRRPELRQSYRQDPRATEPPGDSGRVRLGYCAQPAIGARLPPFRRHRPVGLRRAWESLGSSKGALRAGVWARPPRPRRNHESTQQHRESHQRCEADRRPHVIREHEEGRAEWPCQTSQGDAVEHRTHGVLANAEVQRSAEWPALPRRLSDATGKEAGHPPSRVPAQTHRDPGQGPRTAQLAKDPRRTHSRSPLERPLTSSDAPMTTSPTAPIWIALFVNDPRPAHSRAVAKLSGFCQ